MKKIILVLLSISLAVFGCRTKLSNSQLKDDQLTTIASIDSFYEQTRQFRPYIEILDLTPYYNHFSIAFELPTENRVVELYLHLPDLTTLPSFLSASDSVKIQRLKSATTIVSSEIPVTMKDVATRIKAQLVLEYPTAQSLKIRYDGNIRFVRVREFMPRSVQAIPAKDKVFGVTQFIMSVVKGSSELVMSEFPRFGSNRTTKYCFQSKRADGTYEESLCNKAPRMVAYVAPKDFGGQGPLTYHMGFESQGRTGPNPVLNTESLKARKAIFEASISIDEGTYVNPISEIVVNNSENIPKDLDLNFVLDLTCDLEKTGSGELLRESAVIGFSHQDLMDGKTYSAVFPKSKLTASGTFKQSSVNLSLKKRDHSKTYSVEIEPGAGVEWTPHSGYNYPKNGSLEIIGPNDFDIPADTTFSNYSCFVEARGDGQFQMGGHSFGFFIK